MHQNASSTRYYREQSGSMSWIRGRCFVPLFESPPEARGAGKARGGKGREGSWVEDRRWIERILKLRAQRTRSRSHNEPGRLTKSVLCTRCVIYITYGILYYVCTSARVLGVCRGEGACECPIAYVHFHTLFRYIYIYMSSLYHIHMYICIYIYVQHAHTTTTLCARKKPAEARAGSKYFHSNTF